MTDAMRIDCDACAFRHTTTCEDCVVSYLLDLPPSATVLDLATARTVRLLAEEGLVAEHRHQPRAG